MYIIKAATSTHTPTHPHPHTYKIYSNTNSRKKYRTTTIKTFLFVIFNLLGYFPYHNKLICSYLCSAEQNTKISLKNNNE